MKTRRALIVDDEPRARKDLRILLAAHPEIEVIAEAESVGEAIVLNEKYRPDLIFLDVQMPKRDGFSLLPELRPVPDIIFATAYDIFAVKAFEVNAADYLVKPISEERLDLALSKLDHPERRKAKPFSQNDRIFLYADSELLVVPATQITFIEAEHNYSRVHLASHKATLIRRKISEWHRLLPASFFWRVDRSTIINIPAIKEILPLPRHHAEVHFHQSAESLELRLFASRRLRKAVRKSTQIKPLEVPKI